MLWVKALHVTAVISWIAGLLYLPRLFVYHADTEDDSGHERFIIMERKLFLLMTIAAIAAGVLGMWLLGDYAWRAYGDTLWLPTKLWLVAALIGFHGYCGVLAARFRRKENRHSARFYRLFNEVPAVLMLAIVILVVVKPV